MGPSNLKGLSTTQITKGVIATVAKFTGRDPSKINSKTKFSDLLVDGFDLVAIGDKIDETSWMHGVKIPVQQWQNCATIGDMVKLIAKYV
jgi:acyl carrier protein